MNACKNIVGATTTVPNTCPKCGIIKKLNKLSCCARGGAWFNKCGDGGDSKFDHTWLEGIQACAKAPAKTTASPTASSACRKCGQFKNFGTVSCCALGGAWFNNCGDPGDPGDPKFDHTWYEGIQACKDSASSSSGKARAQDMLLREAT